MKKIICCVGMMCPLVALAWDSTGHRVVAQIAYNHLSPVALAKINSLLPAMAVENFFDTYYGVDDRYDGSNGTNGLLSIAHWPDDLKSQNYLFSSPWHFQDNYWSPDNTALPSPNPENVVWAIGQAVSVLYTQPTSQDGLSTQSDNIRATSLSYLIHFTGDAHQPLHCSSRVTAQIPGGDMGGNKFALMTPVSSYVVQNSGGGVTTVGFAHPIKELHALWDAALGLYPTIDSSIDPTSPVSDTLIPELALAVEKAYPLDHFTPAQQCLAFDSSTNYGKYPSDWGNDWATQWCTGESAALAQTIYPTPDDMSNAVTMNAYMQKWTPIAEERIALAGYRLATVLNFLLDRPVSGNLECLLS